MRVLLLDVLYGEGSTGEIVESIAIALNRRGDAAVALYAFGKGGVYAKKFAFTFETYIHAFLGRITGLFCRYSPLSTRRLIKEIEKYKPDIVHIHDPKPYYLNLHLLLRTLGERHIPTVLTLHSDFFYTGKCGHSMKCSKWMTGCNNCLQLRKYPCSLFFDQTEYMFKQKKKILMR